MNEPLCEYVIEAGCCEHFASFHRLGPCEANCPCETYRAPRRCGHSESEHHRNGTMDKRPYCERCMNDVTLAKGDADAHPFTVREPAH